MFKFIKKFAQKMDWADPDPILSDEDAEIQKMANDPEALYKRGMELWVPGDFKGVMHFAAGEKLNDPACTFMVAKSVFEVLIAQGALNESDNAFKQNIEKLYKLVESGHEPAKAYIEYLKKKL
jgi:hypothetical protein